MKLATRNFEFQWQTRGSPDNPFVLFLHGFMGSARDWHTVMPDLQGEYHCLALDLPDHGQSRVLARNPRYSIATVAREIIELCQHLQQRRLFLVGYSMGGRIALYLAVHYPQFFRGLILESASAGLLSPVERSARQKADEQLARQLEAGDLQTFLLNWYAQPLFKSFRRHPKFAEAFENRLQNDPQKLARALRSLGAGRQPCLWPKLPRLQIPLLFITGEWDEKYRQIGRKIIERCPEGRMKIAPAAGHNVHFENPNIFINALQEFLFIQKERHTHGYHSVG